MTSEASARQLIDRKLEAAGWAVQDCKQVNLGAARGIAVREYPTDTGPADYVLFVHREPVGVIEAKRDGAGGNFSAHEAQTERELLACSARKIPIIIRVKINYPAADKRGYGDAALPEAGARRAAGPRPAGQGPVW